MFHLCVVFCILAKFRFFIYCTNRVTFHMNRNSCAHLFESPLHIYSTYQSQSQEECCLINLALDSPIKKRVFCWCALRTTTASESSMKRGNSFWLSIYLCLDLYGVWLDGKRNGWNSFATKRFISPVETSSSLTIDWRWNLISSQSKTVIETDLIPFYFTATYVHHFCRRRSEQKWNK